jgi:endonuclease/exonuclease/phosphatase family metal-dependent hydrolase
MRLVRAAALPQAPRGWRLKPRGALWVELTSGAAVVQFVNTHLDVVPSQQLAQVGALMGPDWLGHPDCRAPVIACGDFNFGPRTRPFRRLTSMLADAQLALAEHQPRATWSAHFASRRIDHVFLSRDIRVSSVEVPVTEFVRVASDHLPLIVELVVPAREQVEAAPAMAESSRVAAGPP